MAKMGLATAEGEDLTTRYRQRTPAWVGFGEPLERKRMGRKVCVGRGRELDDGDVLSRRLTTGTRSAAGSM
jgi:hypothetical protein